MRKKWIQRAESKSGSALFLFQEFCVEVEVFAS